eukprot:6095073-Pyramimonas_sp.AAC.1
MRNRRRTSKHISWKCGERELLEATPLEDLLTVLTHVIPDNFVLVTVAGEQRGHLPRWGHLARLLEEAYHVP